MSFSDFCYYITHIVQLDRIKYLYKLFLVYKNLQREM